MKLALVACAIMTAVSLTVAALALRAADRALVMARASSDLYREQATCELDKLDAQRLLQQQLYARNNDGWQF